MKALIVDDERLARLELRRLLAAHAEIEIVGEARDGAEALRLVASLSPDLLLLDIQMPGMTGFDLSEMLDDVPAVIFPTAFVVHAIKAFDVNAIDYLLKPIDPSRLAAALGRVRPRAPRPNLTQVFVREGDRCWIVQLADVFLFESEGNYTRVCFGKERPLIRRSLNVFEAQLDPAVFFRANRAQMINMPWIQKVDESVDGGLVATLRGGQRVELSRRRGDSTARDAEFPSSGSCALRRGALAGGLRRRAPSAFLRRSPQAVAEQARGRRCDRWRQTSDTPGW